MSSEISLHFPSQRAIVAYPEPHPLTSEEPMEVEHPSEPPTTGLITDVLPQVPPYQTVIEPVLVPLLSDSEFHNLFQLVTGDTLPSAALFKIRAEAEERGDAAAVAQITHELVNAYQKLQELEGEWLALPDWVQGRFGNIASSKILGNAEFCKLVLRASRAHNLVCVARIYDQQSLYHSLNLSTKNECIEAGERVAKKLVQLKDRFTELRVRLSDNMLYNNQVGFTRLPLEVTNFRNLRELTFDGCEGIRLPKQIKNLSMLAKLNLNNMNLSKIPEWIGPLTHLTEVSLANNHITQLSSPLWNLINLHVLELYGNEITQIPSDIEKLINLKVLSLGLNKIDQLPSQIGNLGNLQRLYVFQNRLTSLPPQIGKLFLLSGLYARNNVLTKIPPEIGNLRFLALLSVEENQLRSVPAELSKIKSLSGLHLKGNRLTSLPKEILEMPDLVIDDRDLTNQGHSPT